MVSSFRLFVVSLLFCLKLDTISSFNLVPMIGADSLRKRSSCAFSRPSKLRIAGRRVSVCAAAAAETGSRALIEDLKSQIEALVANTDSGELSMLSMRIIQNVHGC